MHTIQRRARTGSGPQGPDYSIATECADLAAVRAVTGARYIFGHSYGGLVALEAARRDPGIAELALYEPRVSARACSRWTGPRSTAGSSRKGAPFDAFAISAGPAAARRNPRWLMSAILRLVFRGERRAKIFQFARGEPERARAGRPA